MNKEFFKAVISGEADTVERYLDQGVDPNERNVTGVTALHNAVFYGHTNITSLLVQRGADVNARIQSVVSDEDAGGRTNLSVLQVAAQGNQVQCAQILIDHGADIEAKDENGSTALRDALEFDDHITSPAVARLLVAHGADINSAFKVDHYEGAERFGRFDVVDELIRRNELHS